MACKSARTLGVRLCETSPLLGGLFFLKLSDSPVLLQVTPINSMDDQAGIGWRRDSGLLLPPLSVETEVGLPGKVTPTSGSQDR